MKNNQYTKLLQSKIHLPDILKQVKVDLKLILLLIFSALTISIIYAYNMQPYYRSEALIKISLRKNSPVLNQEDNGFYTIQKISTESDSGILKSINILERSIKNKNLSKKINIKTDYSENEIISKIRSNLKIKETSKDSGLLTLQLDWDDFETSEILLNNIIDEYVKFSRNAQVNQDRQSLLLINNQIPIIRENLEKAERKLKKYYNENNITEYQVELNILGRTISNIENQLTEIRLRKIEIAELYNNNHPRYKTLLEKENILYIKKKNLTNKINSLPIEQRELMQLTNEVDSWRIIYKNLISRKQELSISELRNDSNISIVDRAKSSNQSISPLKIIILFTGCGIGVVFTIAMVVIRFFISTRVFSAKQIENMGIPIFFDFKIDKKKIHISKKVSLLVNKILSKQKVKILSIKCSGKSIINNILCQKIGLYTSRAGYRILYINTEKNDKSILKKGLHFVLADAIFNKLSIDSIINDLINSLDTLSIVDVGNNFSHANHIKMNLMLREIIKKCSPYFDLIIINGGQYHSKEFILTVDHNDLVLQLLIVHEMKDNVLDLLEPQSNKLVEKSNILYFSYSG